jgi:WXG100 family type VII secretion target
LLLHIEIQCEYKKQEEKAMARSITVDPQKLEAAATAMDSQSADYEKSFRQLFSEVDAMATGWDGADNLAFTTQIKGFEDDFKAMVSLIKQYSEFLKMSAKTYKETQNEVANQAKKLVN